MAATVTVDHPIRPDTLEECRFHVALAADPAVHRANNGILDRALEVVLVRRDAPGVRYLAKDDPHALMLPDSVMPPDAPPLPPGCESMDPGTFEATLDLALVDGERTHEGSARYYVLASFADAWADPRPLFVDHRRGPLPSPRVPSPPPRDPSATDVVQAMLMRDGVTARFYPTGGVPRVAGAFRVTSARDVDERVAVTLVAQRLRAQGGVVTAVFAVDAQRFDGALHGQFVVPLASFLSGAEGERVRLLVFVGDELASPIFFEVPDALT